MQNLINGHPMGEHFMVRVPQDDGALVHSAITTPYEGRIHISHDPLGDERRGWDETTDPVTCPACIERLDFLITSWERDVAKKRANKIQDPKQIESYQAVVDSLRSIPVQR